MAPASRLTLSRAGLFNLPASDDLEQINHKYIVNQKDMPGTAGHFDKLCSKTDILKPRINIVERRSTKVGSSDYEFIKHKYEAGISHTGGLVALKFMNSKIFAADMVDDQIKYCLAAVDAGAIL